MPGLAELSLDALNAMSLDLLHEEVALDDSFDEPDGPLTVFTLEKLESMLTRRIELGREFKRRGVRPKYVLECPKHVAASY